MFSTKWLWGVPWVGALGAGVGLDALFAAGDAKQDVKPAVSLPITRVVLFNSGVGYFSRSGEVTDDARVDLSFPEADVNDLLKSMVLEDFNGGRVAAVSYDSREPITRTLASFAVNLNDNPTFAGIVSQTRVAGRGRHQPLRRQPPRQAQWSHRGRGGPEGGGRDHHGGHRVPEPVVRRGPAERPAARRAAA